MFGMLVGLQQTGDQLTAGHTDALPPFDQALWRPLHVGAVRRLGTEPDASVPGYGPSGKEKDGTVLVHLEPLYPGGFDKIMPGSQCMANLYSNHHDEIADPNTSTGRAIALHGIDALGLVHAMLMRIQVALMPFRTLVFSGGH